MKNKKLSKDKEIQLSEEFFELRLVCDTDTIDILGLIKYLNQVHNMMLGINETLNRVYCSGYDAIDVEVFALEHGSIRIPLKLKKYFIKTLMGTIPTIIGGVAVDLISGNKEPIVIVTSEGNVETDSSTFLENRQTKRSVGKIARMVAEDDGISNLSITYEKDNGQLESITIDKKRLKNLADECEDTVNDIINVYPKTRLQIYGPILDNKPTKWKVRMNGHSFDAYMTDKEFLEEMTIKKIAFAPEDEIIADIEELVYEDEKGFHSKWYIRKVHSYPKYTRIVKNARKQEIFNYDKFNEEQLE